MSPWPGARGYRYVTLAGTDILENVMDTVRSVCSNVKRWRNGSALIGALAIFADPVSAGAPFRTDDPEPVEYQHFELDLFSQGTRTDDGWSGMLPGLEVNYGALPDLQVHAIIPQGFDTSPGARTAVALGDIELGVKYRFITPGENDWFPQLAVFPLIEVPTGNQKFGFSTGHVQTFLPVWLQKDFDPWTVYGGGGYWINPGNGNKNYGFFGVAIWRKITDRLSLGAEVFQQTSPAEGVPGSLGFNVGATYDVSANWHLLASAGRGLINAPTTNQFAYYLGLQLTF
jgi:hypothetical protein